MRHLLQDLSTGKTTIVDAPDPAVGAQSLIVRSKCSLISAGTERMLVDFGKANLIDKARQQPEKVKMVLEKVQSDGLLPTIEAVRTKLDQPVSLGYSNVGIVTEIGEDITKFQVGDRVVSNGPHSSVVKTTENLCAKIPDAVDDTTASFAVVSSIALQGIRLASPTLGECFVVIGSGLIGLITIQLLKAQGCRVLAVDIDDEKLDLAKRFGAETCNSEASVDLVSLGIKFSRGAGVDGVIITASTKSSEPVTQAARMSRKRGRIILVGVAGLELNRADFYEKELSFQVSCSYGPGRYDSNYEQKAQDYPIGFVRWTEQRNFEAVLDLMAEKKLDISPLVSHRFEFEHAQDAYFALSNDRSVLGIVLDYPQLSVETKTTQVKLQNRVSSATDHMVIGCIGAGNYASRVLIPSFQKAGVRLHTLVTEGGISAAITGQKAGFENCSSELSHVIENDEINGVVIATRHNSHADLVVKSLQASKHVFVEKPLCLSHTDLERIESVYAASNSILMVGFNRRFAPLVMKVQELLQGVSEPVSLIMTVNAGSIPRDHWTQDKDIGGGRLIGEACHFVDLLRFIAGSEVESSSSTVLNADTSDTFTLNLKFLNGSIGTVHYFANGSKKYPKERLEIFAEGRILQLDNFRELKAFDWPGFRRMKTYTQDKGQDSCVRAFVKAVVDGESAPIPFNEIIEVSRVCIGLGNE